MKQIIITIQVPDGAVVSVNGTATPTASSGPANDRPAKPFVQRPDPPQPSGYCPVHEVDWRLVPGGVSKKTGRPYNGFWACPEFNCDEKPSRDTAPVMEVIGDDGGGLPF